MLAEAGALDPADETFREYERVVDPKYLDQIRAEAKQFSTKRLSRRSGLAEDTIRRFKNDKNSIRPRTLKKLTRAIHDLQNKRPENL
jgi:DNA-binding Xre family transcriptional regulator